MAHFFIFIVIVSNYFIFTVIVGDYFIFPVVDWSSPEITKVSHDFLQTVYACVNIFTKIKFKFTIYTSLTTTTWKS